MKIGIITIQHNSSNYGACLQAYALWKYIENKVDDCELIDVYRPDQKGYIPSEKFPYPMRKDNYIIRCKRFIKRILGIQTKQEIQYSVKAKIKFDRFNSRIKYSMAYKGIDALYSNPPVYDIYISGSDQLWNPMQPYCMEPYFLTFVSEGQKKISYATSIGITKLTNKEKQKFKLWLSSFDAISVREYQGKKLLDSFIGNKEIKQVPDPTFLLDIEDWEKIAVKPGIDRRYILLFILQWSPELVTYCKCLSQESNLQLIVLMQTQPECHDKSYLAVVDAGPQEFIGYIADAEMVITDSFHATVFSIITGVQNFYTYISPASEKGSRITDLLDTFGLENHLLSRELNTTYKALTLNAINRADEIDIMTKIRNVGRDYLDKYILNTN